MKIRSFDWRDLPALYRYRRECIYLHSAWLLTRGRLSMPGAIVSSLTPAAGILTSICTPDGKDNPPLIGQAFHASGLPFAQLTFLTPAQAVNLSTLSSLIEHLAQEIIPRGALRFIADLEETSPSYEVMRSVGFAVYCRQRICELKGENLPANASSGWRVATDQDLTAVHALYHNIVPPLVQQVEPLPTNSYQGLIYQKGDAILSYVEPRYGYRGIWLQPLVHPDLEDLHQALSELAVRFPYRFSRPLFFCVRSYQSWLEPVLEDLGALAGPRQAVMVKHLAVGQRALRTLTIPALEGGQAEVSAPFARTENKT